MIRRSAAWAKTGLWGTTMMVHGFAVDALPLLWLCRFPVLHYPDVSANSVVMAALGGGHPEKISSCD